MMELERDEEGHLWFRGLPPLHADTLLQVPEWLETDDPRAQARLLPPAYEDPDEQEQWRRYGSTELEHLFASRTQLIQKDLTSLAPDGEETFCVRLLEKHATAWLSALNGARLVLFTLHDFDEEAMEMDPADLDDLEREIALVRIHIMAYMQEMLIEAGV